MLESRDTVCPGKTDILELSICFSENKQFLSVFQNQFLNSFLLSILTWKKIYADLGNQVLLMFVITAVDNLTLQCSKVRTFIMSAQ